MLRRTARQGGPEGLIAARWLSGAAARWLSGTDEQNSVALLAQVAADKAPPPSARRLAAGAGATRVRPSVLVAPQRAARAQAGAGAAHRGGGRDRPPGGAGAGGA